MCLQYDFFIPMDYEYNWGSEKFDIYMPKGLVYIGQQTEPIHLLPSSKLKTISMNQRTRGLAAVDPESFYLEFYILQTDSLSLSERKGREACLQNCVYWANTSLTREGRSTILLFKDEMLWDSSFQASCCCDPNRWCFPGSRLCSLYMYPVVDFLSLL